MRTSRWVIVLAVAVALGLAPVAVEASGASHVSAHPQQTVVEDDPYTVLKPWIGTHSSIVKANRTFSLFLDGFESRERVEITIGTSTITARTWRSGKRFVKLRAPHVNGVYDIVATGETSNAPATTTVRVYGGRR